MKRLVIYLIRKRLGVRKYQHFRFKNQKSRKEYYWFTEDAVMKRLSNMDIRPSSVSLNWLLDDECEIIICD